MSCCAQQPGKPWPVRELGMKMWSRWRNRLQCGLETSPPPSRLKESDKVTVRGQRQEGGLGPALQGVGVVVLSRY